MRESRRTEKTHLPRDSYEEWSESQTARVGAFEHRTPPENTYEVWVEKLVEKRLGRKAGRRAAKH